MPLAWIYAFVAQLWLGWCIFTIGAHRKESGPHTDLFDVWETLPWKSFFWNRLEVWSDKRRLRWYPDCQTAFALSADALLIPDGEKWRKRLLKAWKHRRYGTNGFAMGWMLFLVYGLVLTFAKMFMDTF